MLAKLFNISVDSDGKIIPEGLEVGIFAYGIHHDRKVYPDPEKFEPQRFAGATNRSPYAYIPFSAGSRNCIGIIYYTYLSAMQEIKGVFCFYSRNL